MRKGSPRASLHRWPQHLLRRRLNIGDRFGLDLGLRDLHAHLMILLFEFQVI
jgi:hypothetical protein